MRERLVDFVPEFVDNLFLCAYVRKIGNGELIKVDNRLFQCGQRKGLRRAAVAT